jgi:hypothetical protein
LLRPADPHLSSRTAGLARWFEHEAACVPPAAAAGKQASRLPAKNLAG